jgi:hypothetical protein
MLFAVVRALAAATAAPEYFGIPAVNVQYPRYNKQQV